MNPFIFERQKSANGSEGVLARHPIVVMITVFALGGGIGWPIAHFVTLERFETLKENLQEERYRVASLETSGAGCLDNNKILAAEKDALVERLKAIPVCPECGRESARVDEKRKDFIVRKKDVSCLGGRDGEAAVVLLDGESDFSFKWSTEDTGPRISGLSAGTYQLRVKKNGGLWVREEVRIDAPAEPLEVEVRGEGASSAGGRDGTAWAVARGGTWPYEYRWSTGDRESNLSGLVPGTYSVAVKDGSGCVVVDSVGVAAAMSDSGEGEGESEVSEFDGKGADALESSSEQGLMPGGHDQLLTPGPDTEIPRLRQMLRPPYPSAARPYRREGYVLVEVLIESSGRVSSKIVRRSDILGFKQSALETLDGVVFDPSKRNGVPGRMWTTVRCWWSASGTPGWCDSP